MTQGACEALAQEYSIQIRGIRWHWTFSLYGPGMLWLFRVFSSPEPLGSQGELIVYPYSGVRCRRCRRRCRRQQCLNIFSSETALPIKAKFYVEPPWEGGTKVCINGPGHMTKMAAMPLYGKNLKISSSPEPEVLWSWNLARSIGDSSSTKFV